MKIWGQVTWILHLSNLVTRRQLHISTVEALLGASASGNGQDQPKEKKKRIIPKLTEAMMMGPHGLTNLIHRANKFKKRSSNVRFENAFFLSYSI